MSLDNRVSRLEGKVEALLVLNTGALVLAFATIVAVFLR